MDACFGLTLQDQSKETIDRRIKQNKWKKTKNKREKDH
jgi:hypothetical protein